MREASARAACQNNLKQITIALHCYADAHGVPSATLPPGTMPNPALPPESRLSWQAAILPYIEQQAIYNRLDPKAAWDAGANAASVQVPLRVFQCPSWVPNGAVGVTTYIGIAGVGPDAATLPGDSPRAGVFGYDRRTRMTDISDGTSNTLLLMESARDVGPWARGGPATVRGLDPADRPHLGKGRAFGGNHFPNKSWFNHDRDVPATAAMADGSVRVWYPSRVSPEVLEALATVAGGEDVIPD